MSTPTSSQPKSSAGRPAHPARPPRHARVGGGRDARQLVPGGAGERRAVREGARRRARRPPGSTSRSRQSPRRQDVNGKLLEDIQMTRRPLRRQHGAGPRVLRRRTTQARASRRAPRPPQFRNSCAILRTPLIAPLPPSIRATRRWARASVAMKSAGRIPLNRQHARRRRARDGSRSRNGWPASRRAFATAPTEHRPSRSCPRGAGRGCAVRRTQSARVPRRRCAHRECAASPWQLPLSRRRRRRRPSPLEFFTQRPSSRKHQRHAISRAHPGRVRARRPRVGVARPPAPAAAARRQVGDVAAVGPTSSPPKPSPKPAARSPREAAPKPSPERRRRRRRAAENEK